MCVDVPLRRGRVSYGGASAVTGIVPGYAAVHGWGRRDLHGFSSVWGMFLHAVRTLGESGVACADSQGARGARGCTRMGRYVQRDVSGVLGTLGHPQRWIHTRGGVLSGHRSSRTSLGVQGRQGW
jgi:hypothetical protein